MGGTGEPGRGLRHAAVSRLVSACYLRLKVSHLLNRQSRGLAHLATLNQVAREEAARSSQAPDSGQAVAGRARRQLGRQRVGEGVRLGGTDL